jgi:DNA end-binding protein Ku
MAVIPVSLGTVVSKDELPLHRVRRSDGSRVRQPYTAEADGQPVAFADTVMGYDAGNGTVVLVEDSDFDLAYGEKNRNARIVAFVPAGSLPRTAHEASYYVEPGKGGEQAYQLLATALRRSGKAAVVSVAVRKREALALLYPTGDGYLVLERLQWASAVKKPDFAAPSGLVAENGVELAENYISLMTEPFDWTAQADTSAQALADVIRAKAETGQVIGAPAAPLPGTPTDPADLMAALTASVEQAKAAKAPVRKPRARKPRARKAPVKAAAVKAAA